MAACTSGLWKPFVLHPQMYMTEVENVEDKLNEFRKCFQPWQWFIKEDASGLPFEFTEEIFMWVYRKTENGKFATGYFLPDGNWFCDDIFNTVEEARDRVRYLMGGDE